MKGKNNFEDVTATFRKKDHIELALKSQQDLSLIDQRFYYEPLLSKHLTEPALLQQTFLSYSFELPFWVSSMTGGTEQAKDINIRLAKACGKYNMGMGLGSCRQLLSSDEYLADFKVKEHMPDSPLFANLGVAQVEQIANDDAWEKIENLIEKLDADGLIIHVNPLQEWLQPEGDRFEQSPLITIKQALNNLTMPIIVKEVGQGMGPESLLELMQLPLSAIEFAALGGTNFSTIELMRSESAHSEYKSVANIGHKADEMVSMLNKLIGKYAQQFLVKDIIISGGINSFLDSYYLRKKCKMNAISGHASLFLKYALEGEDALYKFIEGQRDGLLMAESFLKVR